MNVLSSKKVLQDQNSSDPDAITSLSLTHKALSDVSCLSDFKNLERLDLAFNNLSSLEGLKSCVNLKWLSVVQNKLKSLKGIEGLTKLTVLNAGKNKLRSMDEVRSLLSLRALILNDNEIVSLCRLGQIKELNTLVLSRNPIREIGESLAEVKLITKLSLSNCQLQTIDSSLKSCTELKELRLAHNDIETLPGELACNMKIQNLDLGNNSITRWSDLKVVSSLVNLRNLNLQGNPIAENDRLTTKIKKLVPNLQIYNAKPIDKTMKSEKDVRVDDSSFDVGNKPVVQKGEQKDQSMGKKGLKHHVVSQSKGDHLDIAGDLDMEQELKHKKQKRNDQLKEKASDHKGNRSIIENTVKKKLKTVQENDNIVIDIVETPYLDPDLPKELTRKKQRANELSEEKVSALKGNNIITEKEFDKKSKKLKQNVVSVIDDGGIPFMDLFAADAAENAENSGKKMDHKTIQDVNMIDGLVTFPKKRKKIKSQGVSSSALQLLTSAADVGLGGPSTWDDN